ncbi:LacI family DNA-binding transcriptional regulator [Streptomyces sp. NPDC006265]|uniref:LacI family DNA-binding transcriptional regulator n=1 Tax=Streptomyces sp. NPDC006265 TaxID=3156740 RepID=UPI0033A1237B
MGSAEEKPATGSGRPTSRDVARLAGVSHTAVSFVFNGRAAGNLSPATQERIRQAATQLGYRPDPVARGLRRSRTAVIGLVTDEIASSPFAGRLLRGAMDTAWAGEHLVLTIDSGGDPDKEDAAVAELLDNAAPELRPTGIFAYNDRVAAGVLHAATRLGITVPGDLSVVGYDDQEHMAAHLAPPLTTVALPHREMGEVAARLLLDSLATGRTPPATVRRLACPVISRSSVGPAPIR